MDVRGFCRVGLEDAVVGFTYLLNWGLNTRTQTNN